MGGAIASVCLAVFIPLAVVTSGTAFAQSQFETITTINAPPERREVPRRRAGSPDLAVPTPPGVVNNPFATRLIRPGDPVDADAEPATEGGRFDPSADPDAGIVRPTVPVDGDFRPPVQAAEPVDGDLALPRRTFPVDGSDPTSNDFRDETDRAVFEQPPAGYDPTLFNIEVSPILTERPRQLFRFEPYTPLGIRVGSFIVLPTVENALVFDSNVFQSTPAERDIAYEVVPTIRVVSNWNVHALELGASGVFSRFREFDSEDAREYALEARGRVDITRRTNIEGLVSRAVTQENRSAIDSGPVTADPADVTINTAALTLNHRFNRLRVQLRGSVSEEDTSDITDTTGAVVINDDRDQVDTEVAVRTSWEFKPTLFGFTEVAFIHRQFAAVSLDDGISRDSRGERYRAGVSFGNTDQILRGEVSLGYGEQRPDDETLAPLRGMIVDANLAWRMSALTTWLLTLQTEFDDTTSAGSVGAITRSAGLEVRHAFRSNVIANAGVNFTQDDFSGTNLTEREWQANLGLEYFLNRNMALFARYQYTNFDSDDVGRDYTDNEVRIGMRLAR